jgi:hypothetical protein
MATFDYGRARATAARLIARFGQSATIRRTTRSGPAYDPVVATEDHACKAAVLSYSDKQIDGSRIRDSDSLVYLSTAGLSIAPTESDALIIGGVAHEIVRVKPLSPAETTIFWEIQARR